MPSHSTHAEEVPPWAHLLNLEEVEQFSERSWRPEEMGAVFRHQLASPVQFDLHALGEAASELQAVCAAEGLLLRSFNDLLFHPHPPVELLEMTKRFAKANYYHADAVMPREVASVLYYASILVARLRWGRRITDLEDARLAEGVQWAISRPWVDDTMRDLLSEGLRKITSASPRRGGGAEGGDAIAGEAAQEVR